MTPPRDPFRSSVALCLLLLLAAGLAQTDPVAELPVTRVVLFTSGVGYFEHGGLVNGDQEIELAVAGEQMDDLLQSLVLQDLDGGTIEPVRYEASDPLERILSSYAIDLSRAPTLTDLLQQARGEPLFVEAGRPLTGTLLGVERVSGPDDTVTTFLTLSTSDGLQRIALDDIGVLRFERDEVQADLDAALAAIARYRSTDDRTVRLRFSGEGERRVRVGYVREMPVWKTSYRLVLADDDRAVLQGWAIFDNPTSLDLEDVAVSFVAGQPISFVTDLYAPVYVFRPRVQVQTAPTVVPRTDAGNFRAADAEPAPAEAEAGFGALAPAPAAAPQLQQAGVDTMATGTRTGATFSYDVREPVTVGRYESAMIPIVQETVEAHQLSLYDPALLAGHPLRAVRLVNDTGLHLAAGTVTLFGPGGFTGNARLGDVPAGETRMLSYAVDLDVDILTSAESEAQQVTAVSLRNGLLEISLRQRLRTSYRIEVAEGETRFLVIEHPRVAGFEVIAPDPAPAETAGGYRFGVEIGQATADGEIPSQLRCEPAGDGCVLEVVLERTVGESVALTNIPDDRLAFYLENVELSAADSEVLSRILELKRQLARLDRTLSDTFARLSAIDQEQSRIRQNMAQLDRNSQLYRRYVTDLADQEDEIDALQTRIEDLRAERSALQERLDRTIADLDTD